VLTIDYVELRTYVDCWVPCDGFVEIVSGCH